MKSHIVSRKSVFILVLLLIDAAGGKRGGGGGFGRGGGFGSRGSSAARASSSKSGGGGGWFGGGGTKTGGTGMQHGGGGAQPNYGRTGTGTGGWSNSGKSGGGYRNSGFTTGGIGSRSRSDTFKNMIVGAAAGYLTYQAGKHIIRSMTSPMAWNGRNYYWGQQYYPGGGYSSGRAMCRMPIEPGDNQFGQIYTPEGSRPKEIVWSCGPSEHCCGYECCPGGYGGGQGYGGGRWNSGPGIGLGTILLLLLICGCAVFIVKKLYDRKRESAMEEAANKGYQPGNVSYSANAPNAEAPPPYLASYPPENGVRYPPA